MWVNVALDGAFRHYYGFEGTRGNATDGSRAVAAPDRSRFLDRTLFGVVRGSKDSTAVVNLRSELISEASGTALSVGQRYRGENGHSRYALYSRKRK